MNRLILRFKEVEGGSSKYATLPNKEGLIYCSNFESAARDVCNPIIDVFAPGLRTAMNYDVRITPITGNIYE